MGLGIYLELLSAGLDAFVPALAVELVIHVPVYFLVLGAAVEDPVAEAAAFIGLFLADGAPFHNLFRYLFYNNSNKINKTSSNSRSDPIRL